MNKRNYGPAIGTFLGKIVYKFFQEDNIKYIFDRFAKCDTEGCPLDQVRSDEVLLVPGLIYKRAS